MNAPATTQTNPPAAKPPSIKQLLEGEAFKSQVAKALPSHLKPDRMIRVALTALTKTPKLAECDKASLFAALLTCSQFGLEPDGRHAHLIPYGTTCQLILDYKGLVDLAYRSGMVESIHADVVCEHDTFRYNLGIVEAHEINLRKPRGAVYAAYARAALKGGAVKCEVMSAEEIDSIRNRSRSGDKGPWKTDYNEMAKKTVFRRLSKWLPLSAEYRDAAEMDDDRAQEITGAVAADHVYSHFNDLKNVTPVDEKAAAEIDAAKLAASVRAQEEREAKAAKGDAP